MMKIAAASLFLLLCGCAATTPKTVDFATPVLEFKADWDKPEWTSILEIALVEDGQALLSGYYPGVCGDRKAFWIMLLSSLARYESNFRPETSYQEEFPDSNGVRVVSRGLFQLSKESVNGSRYRCGIKDAKELHDPIINIRCAVKVANALVNENEVIFSGPPWKGLARYWSPFRSKEKSAAILAKARATCQ